MADHSCVTGIADGGANQHTAVASRNNEEDISDSDYGRMGRERSSSDMTLSSELAVPPPLGARARFPSAPLVAEEATGIGDSCIIMAKGGNAATTDTTAAGLDYRLRDTRHLYRDSIESESRLGVYCSPRFYRKTNYATAGIPYGEVDSFPEEFFGPDMDTNSPTESNGSSARSELSKKSFQDSSKKKRPLSLVGLDSRRRMREGTRGAPPEGISNLGSSCCNLRTSLVERPDPRIRSPTSRGGGGGGGGVQQSNLSPFTERTPSTFQLSRSCSDLRDGFSPVHPTIQGLRCPSHISLQSIRVSSPSESRISLLSDLEALERAHHHPRHADSPPLYPEVGGPPMSSDALVQEWLARQEKFISNRQSSDPLKLRTKTQPT